MAQITREFTLRFGTMKELLDAATGYDCLMDPKDFEAYKVYLLGLILKQLSGLETDNFCDVIDTMKQYDYLSEYQRQAIYVYLLGQIAEAVGVDDSAVSEATIQEQLRCACSSSKQSMKLAEILLLYAILAELGQV